MKLYAVFAHDGRAVKPLEKTPFDQALQDGELTTKWKSYQNVDLGMVRLKQVARAESLSADPRESSALRSQNLEATNSRDTSVSRSQQLEASNSDVLPSNSSAVQLDETLISQRSQKRASSLPKRNQAKRRRVSSLAATKRKKPSNRSGSDTRYTVKPILRKLAHQTTKIIGQNDLFEMMQT